MMARTLWRRSRQFARIHIALPLGIALAASFVAGCQSHPLAEERLAMRTARIERTLDALVDRESQGADKIANTLDVARRAVVRHERQLADTSASIGRQLDRDLERWRRRQPIYLEQVDRELRGQPERIIETLIMLFY